MESLKSMYNNMSDMSKMLIKMLLGIIAALLFMFLIVFVVRIIGGGKKGYSSTESTMQSAAVKYFKKHKSKLPLDNEETVVNVNTLVSEEYMKELTKYVGKNTTCKGNVTVLNNDGNYIYLPYLDCGKKYKTELLKDSILKDNEVVESGDGLYLDDDGNYIFRGEFVNNYLIFNNLKFRILRINADGSIKLFLAGPIKGYKSTIWDDRYNIEKDDKTGINNYAKSRIKDYLYTIYKDDEIFNNNAKALMKKQSLCVASRDIDSEDLTDAQECSETLDNEELGLLQLNEYVLPSIDENCTKASDKSCINYNYMKSYQQSFWSITPYADDTYQVYRIANAVYLAKAKSTGSVLFTLSLSDKAQLKSGDGSSENPYIVKDYNKSSNDKIKNAS